MSNIVIRVENLTKEYRLGSISHGTLREDLQSWWARLRGKEDPNSIISHQSSLQPSTFNLQPNANPHFLALNNVSFDVKQGEAVGIIGRNGAGKSTLLKILSRVTTQTSGVVKIKGRIASLLEVGTGFHPDLTGRENIFLNGTILGMKRAEIQRKFDEIVAFAEIEQFIDTPVKRYSSGMYVRLAFAVAAHLEPEILIVDEVLAVGDAAFQKKCLGKMGEVGKQGRTVLFVSHNMTAVQNFCSKAIYLHKGSIIDIGLTHQVVERYINDSLSSANLVWRGEHSENHMLKINCIQIVKQNMHSDELYINEDIHIEILVDVFNEATEIAFEISVHTVDGAFAFSSYTETMTLKKGLTVATCLIPKNIMNNGHYTIMVIISKNWMSQLVKIDEALTIELLEKPEGLGWQGDWPGVVRPKLKWEVKMGCA